MKRIASIVMMSFMAVIFLGLITLAFALEPKVLPKLPGKPEKVLPAPPEKPPKITATLVAIPPSYPGKCPKTIKFEGQITVANIKKPLKLQYRFIRSDGATAPLETLTFDNNGTKKIDTTWTLGGPGLPTYEGWVAIKVIYPQDVESNKANFKIECPKPTDLTINIANWPKSAKADQIIGKLLQVVVANQGNTAVKGVIAIVSLRTNVYCPIPPPLPKDLFVSPPHFFNGIPIGGDLNVSLKPGETKDIVEDKPYSIPADTPTGNYYLCAVVDAGDFVEETNEKNNCTCSPIKIAGEAKK